MLGDWLHRNNVQKAPKSPMTPIPTRAVRRRFLRYKAVVERTGLSKRTIENLVGDRQFVQPVKIGVRAVGFVEAEVDAWIDARITARDESLTVKAEARKV